MPAPTTSRVPAGQVLSGRAGATVLSARVAAPATSVDLDVNCVEDAAGLHVEFTYDRDVLRERTVAELAEAYRSILDGALARPLAPISELPVTSDRQRRTLRAWRGDGVPATAAASVLELFDAAATRQPDAAALVAGGTTMSYAELAGAAGDLAWRLRGEGVGPGDLVALGLHRGADLVVAMLAVARAGAAFLPLDPSHPAPRLRRALAARPARCVLATEQTRAAFDGSPVVVLDGSAGPRAGRLPAPAGGDLAYVLFTSGSTGEPKAVAVRHRSLAAIVAAELTVFGLGPGDRQLQFASATFDAALSEVFTTLAAGATLVVPPGPANRTDLVDVVRAHGVTAVQLPPSVLALVHPDDLPGVRLVVNGGEACPPEVARAWAGRVRLVNAYGPTETTISACAAVLDPDSTVPIGRPLPGVHVHVLDDRQRPVPPDRLGQVVRGAAGVELVEEPQPVLGER